MRLVRCVVRCCLLHSRCTRTSPGTAAHSGPGRRLSAISCTEITVKISKLETADLHSCASAWVWRHFSLTDSLLGAEKKKDGLHISLSRTSTSKHSWRPKQTHCSFRTIWSGCCCHIQLCICSHCWLQSGHVHTSAVIGSNSFCESLHA